MSLVGGRPQTPVKWATVTDYPGSYSIANPWQGQPLKTVPVLGYFLPGAASPPAAEEVNYMHWQTSTDVSALAQQSGTPDGLNWPKAITAFGSAQNASNQPVWVSAEGCWYIAGQALGGSVAAFNRFDGSAWAQDAIFTGGSNSYLMGIVGRPTDGALLGIGNFNGTVESVVVNPIANTTNAGQTCGVALVSSVATSGAWFNSLWVIWPGHSGTTPYYCATDAAVFTAATTWSPPGSFVSNALAHIISPTAILIFPEGTSVVSKYMRTTDGQNWAQVSMPALNSGESVRDATYDPVGGFYYMLTSTTSTTRVWQSPSGTASSWTVQSTFSHQGYGLKANGTELLAWIAYAGVYRGIMSVDGGVTWYLTSLLDATAPFAAGTASAFSLKCSGGQFMYCNNNKFAASGVAGSALTQLTL